MNWMILSLSSAVFLGLYDIAKKAAVRDNAVPPVLLLNVLTAAALWIPIMLWSSLAAESMPFQRLQVDAIAWRIHGMLLLKSVIAGSSWIFALYALKHLPMSIAAPIRATSPFWTILIAVAWMNERPNAGQWVGVSIILASFYAFSLLSRREGIHFQTNRWVWCMVAATLLGSLSALYDKYLLQTRHLKAATVQAWFSVYLVLVMLPLAVRWWRKERATSPFQWRWSIPMIAVLLLISDFLYFTAIEQPGAYISLISPLRRTSVIIAFVAGIRVYGEKNWRPKAVCVISLLIGVYVISLARN